MTYATQMQIQIAAGGSARLIELTDQEGAIPPIVNLTVLGEAQAKAAAWMHTYLRKLFEVPVPNLTPEGAASLARLEADETVYQLIYPTRVLGESDTLKRKLRQEELEAIASGKIRIDEPSPTPSSAVQATIVTRVGPITRRGMRGLL